MDARHQEARLVAVAAGRLAGLGVGPGDIASAVSRGLVAAHRAGIDPTDLGALCDAVERAADETAQVWAWAPDGTPADDPVLDVPLADRFWTDVERSLQTSFSGSDGADAGADDAVAGPPPAPVAGEPPEAITSTAEVVVGTPRRRLAVFAVIAVLIGAAAGLGLRDRGEPRPADQSTAPSGPSGSGPSSGPPASPTSTPRPEFPGPSAPGRYSVEGVRTRLGASQPVGFSLDQRLLYVRAGARLGVVEVAGGTKMLDVWGDSPDGATVDSVVFNPRGEVAALVLLPGPGDIGVMHVFRGVVAADGTFASMTPVPIRLRSEVPDPVPQIIDLTWTGPGLADLEAIVTPIAGGEPSSDDEPVLHATPGRYRVGPEGSFDQIADTNFALAADGNGRTYWVDAVGRVQSERDDVTLPPGAGHHSVVVSTDGQRLLVDGRSLYDTAGTLLHRFLFDSGSSFRTEFVADDHLLVVVQASEPLVGPRWFLVEVVDGGAPCIGYECADTPEAAVQYSELSIRPDVLMVTGDLSTVFAWSASTVGAALDRHHLGRDG